MELYLQMGHGMRGLCQEMISSWGGGTVILSPVNIEYKKLSKYSESIKKMNGQLLFDPQLYFGEESKENLKKYPHWSEAVINGYDYSYKTYLEIVDINSIIGSTEIIIPSELITKSSLPRVLKQIKSGVKTVKEITSKNIIISLVISPEIIKNNNAVEFLIDQVSNLDVLGFYVITQNPNLEYIVYDPTWSIAVLKLLTGLKFSKKKIIVGYSNHQSLLYGLAKVDAIASGNYMNTRTFNPGRFKKIIDNQPKRRSTWYYNPKAMSEYNITQLDVAKQRGFLELFKPQGLYASQVSDKLFMGAMPSSTNFKDSDSFKHYLHCLKIQCSEIVKESYKKTYDNYEFLLNTAEDLNNSIRKFGISLQTRDFYQGIESNRIAMIACSTDYGFKLSLEWNEL